MTQRIAEIKRNHPVKTGRSTKRGLECMREISAYRPGVKICIERARLMTESFKQTEGEPTIKRKAKALDHVLQNMSIYIEDGQLIVGNYASTPYSLPVYPEVAVRWVVKETNASLKDLINDADKKELAEIAAYWGNKQAHGKEREYLTEDLRPYWAYNGATMLWRGAESGVPNYDKIFRLGLKGIMKQAEDRLTSLSDMTLLPKDYVETIDFLRATIITLKAVINFSKRFAKKACELAIVETDTGRKKEMKKLANNCEWVPENPPRDFHEALQSFWFIHIITHMIELYMNGCAVRLDQLLYPYYEKDKKEGKLTEEGALELLECLFLKMDEHTQLMPPVTLSGSGTAHGWSTIAVGGVNREGKDASNELSYLILDACRELQLPQPSIAFRYHDNIPHDLVLRAIDLARTGIGYPAFFNDRYEVAALVDLGIPLEDARDYGIEACMRWTIPGKNICYRANCGMLILPKFLELALNQGWDKFSGKQLGLHTRDPITFISYDDVMDVFLEQAKFFIEKLVRLNNIIDVFYEEDLCRPLLSPLLDGCIEKGKDCRKWSYFYKTIFGPMGTTSVGDALAAMKKLVFEEKKVTMNELLDALRNNWEGKEYLRQMFINEAPKFGNDDDYVDHIVFDIQKKVTDIVKSYTNYLGFPYLMDGSSGAAYWGYSGLLAATPDGRKDLQAFNDGTISPAIGEDKKGPTAVLASVAKVDPRQTFNQLLNQKFLPTFLEGENRELFSAYLKTWADLGIHHVQFNVVDAKKLCAAQKNPEEYSDLVIRVAGYSAYFVDLPKGLQDSIIERTEQDLVGV
ncbi:MAG: pyruvate formate lyase family protein [Chloroflexota bacterium]|nr:pyruvate formate lyase family protein [Chloroflexota bacterium]